MNRHDYRAGITCRAAWSHGSTPGGWCNRHV